MVDHLMNLPFMAPIQKPNAPNKDIQAKGATKKRKPHGNPTFVGDGHQDRRRE